MFNYSPDGKTLAIQDGKSVRLWDIETDSHKAILSGHLKGILSIKYSPNGQFLSTAGGETIRLWNTQTGEQIAIYTPDHRYQAHGFLPIFSPDSNLLATPTKDLKMVQIWNTDTGHPQFLFMGHRWNVRSVIFSPDGNNIVSNCSAKAFLWDAKTGRRKGTLYQSRKIKILTSIYTRWEYLGRLCQITV